MREKKKRTDEIILKNGLYLVCAYKRERENRINLQRQQLLEKQSTYTQERRGTCIRCIICVHAMKYFDKKNKNKREWIETQTSTSACVCVRENATIGFIVLTYYQKKKPLLSFCFDNHTKLSSWESPKQHNQ
jgi:hypothetical protein